jgi:2-desacetyl-2-hydroxyethyl bacteriochlorophyllide A dehydrogenase
MTDRNTLYFKRPYQVEVLNETLPTIQPHQVMVQTAISAISAGTELLFYRGQVPAGMAVDATISNMDGTVQYPLPYGYACAGTVISVGNQVDLTWQGRRVFAFHPHTSAFLADPSALIPIPDDFSFEQAVFLPNAETAVNFVMDARPIVGERLLLLGLGVVGLLTLHLLRRFPLEHITAIDSYTKRRELARAWGADTVLAPDQLPMQPTLNPDLILELSSNPAALTTAVEVAGYGTRILVGSWYGDKLAHLPLGGIFHRNRIQLFSSQVSTLDGQFANRWNKARRLDTAWSTLRTIPIADLITHRLPITAASQAYQLLDQQPDQALQILFTY